METLLLQTLIPLAYMLATIKTSRFWFRYYDWEWKQDRIANACMSLGIGFIWPLVIMLFFVLAPTHEEKKEMKEQRKAVNAAMLEAKIAQQHRELGMKDDDK
jgi:hypothetical protein